MAKSFDSLVARTTSKATRQKAAVRTRELLGEMLIAEIRQMTGKSQRELADILGIKQPSLSKLEKQDDMQIKTLEGIVHALGGNLRLVAAFPEGDIGVTLGRTTRTKSLRQSRQARVA